MSRRRKKNRSLRFVCFVIQKQSRVSRRVAALGIFGWAADLSLIKSRLRYTAARGRTLWRISAKRYPILLMKSFSFSFFLQIWICFPLRGKNMAEEITTQPVKQGGNYWRQTKRRHTHTQKVLFFYVIEWNVLCRWRRLGKKGAGNQIASHSNFFSPLLQFNAAAAVREQKWLYNSTARQTLRLRMRFRVINKF